MVHLIECTQILNQTKGKRKFTEEEVKQIRNVLERMAEIEHSGFIYESFTNEKNEQK